MFSAEDRVALILGRSIMKNELLTVSLEGLQIENKKLNDTLNEQEESNTKMSEDEQDEAPEIGWYVSDTHCRRALGYLSVKLAEGGYVKPDFESPLLLDLWEESMAAAMETSDPSPIGPDPDRVREILAERQEGKDESVVETTSSDSPTEAT
jgi:hypothetical protein